MADTRLIHTGEYCSPFSPLSSRVYTPNAFVYAGIRGSATTSFLSIFYFLFCFAEESFFYSREYCKLFESIRDYKEFVYSSNPTFLVEFFPPPLPFIHHVTGLPPLPVRLRNRCRLVCAYVRSP